MAESLGEKITLLPTFIDVLHLFPSLFLPFYGLLLRSFSPPSLFLGRTSVPLKPTNQIDLFRDRVKRQSVRSLFLDFLFCPLQKRAKGAAQHAVPRSARSMRPHTSIPLHLRSPLHSPFSLSSPLLLKSCLVVRIVSRKFSRRSTSLRAPTRREQTLSHGLRATQPPDYTR